MNNKIEFENKIKMVTRKLGQKMVWKDFFGDILYCDKYIYGLVEESDRERMVPLTSALPWKAMERFGIEGASTLRDESCYTCPWTDNSYFWFVPYALIINGSPDVYKPKEMPQHLVSQYDYSLDLKWHARYFKNDPPPSDIQLALLGHGYTSFTLPSDGSGSVWKTKIQLSNGDFIAGFMWVWYNK